MRTCFLILLTVGCGPLRPDAPIDCRSRCGLTLYRASQFCPDIDRAEAAVLDALADRFDKEAFCRGLAGAALTTHPLETEFGWYTPGLPDGKGGTWPAYETQGSTSWDLLITVGAFPTLDKAAPFLLHEIVHVAERTVGPEPDLPHVDWSEKGIWLRVQTAVRVFRSGLGSD